MGQFSDPVATHRRTDEVEVQGVNHLFQHNSKRNGIIQIASCEVGFYNLCHVTPMNLKHAYHSRYPSKYYV